MWQHHTVVADLLAAQWCKSPASKAELLDWYLVQRKGVFQILTQASSNQTTIFHIAFDQLMWNASFLVTISLWSSAAVAHLLWGSKCCEVRDVILHTLTVRSDYLGYCCLPICSKHWLLASMAMSACINALSCCGTNNISNTTSNNHLDLSSNAIC